MTDYLSNIPSQIVSNKSLEGCSNNRFNDDNNSMETFEIPTKKPSLHLTHAQTLNQASAQQNYSQTILQPTPFSPVIEQMDTSELEPNKPLWPTTTTKAPNKKITSSCEKPSSHIAADKTMEVEKPNKSRVPNPDSLFANYENELMNMVYSQNYKNSREILSDSAVSSNEDGSSTASSSVEEEEETLSVKNSRIPNNFRSNVAAHSRRQTINAKFPNYLLNSPKKGVAGLFKFEHNSVDGNPITQDLDEDFGPANYGFQRRFSVPEKTLLSANYAILRKNMDRKVEVVGAFPQHSIKAYQNFLQSLTCYDLAPQHGVVIMLEATLTIHKAVSILCTNSLHKVAIICNAKNRDKEIGIFTITDCLQILKTGSEDRSVDLGTKTLQFFLDNIQTKKKMITTYSTTKVWDVAQLFRLNRIHRIPIIQDDCLSSNNEILGLFSLRSIFVEILKLFDSKCILKPDLRILTLESTKVGNWTNIISISEKANCLRAIEKFLTCKVSCLPILNKELKLTGILTKNNVIEALAIREKNYMEVLDLSVMEIAQPLYEDYERRIINQMCTLEEVIRVLNSSNSENGGFRQTLCIIDDEKNLLGVISYANIMDYLLQNSNSP